MTNIWNTGQSVPSIPLNNTHQDGFNIHLSNCMILYYYLGTGPTFIEWLIRYRIAGYTLITRFSSAGISLTEPTVSLISWRTTTTPWTFYSIPAVYSRWSFKTWIRDIRTFRFLYLTGFTLLQSFTQHHSFFSLCFNL